MATTHQPQRTHDPKIKQFWSTFTADHTVLPYDPDVIAKRFDEFVDEYETPIGPDAAAAMINEHTTATIPSSVVERTWDEIDDVTKYAPMEVVAELMHVHAIALVDSRNQTPEQSPSKLFRAVHTTKEAVEHFALFVKSKISGKTPSYTVDDPTISQ